MSVLVKGMDMPFSCYECPLVHREFNGVETELYCYALEKAVSDEDRTRDDECPLVEVPTPHGRLIDHKKLEKDLGERWNVNDDQDFCNKEVWHALEEAPTVIEEEE